tara:strand:+ start:2760 stop:3353 length:594 start_codon:yes stop_codon:yes gene_type:complete
MDKELILEFYRRLKHPLWSKFKFHVHGSALTNLGNAADLDLKLVPITRVTLKEIEIMLAHVDKISAEVELPVDINMIRKIESYNPTYKPSTYTEIFKNDYPVLWATNQYTAKQLRIKRKTEATFVKMNGIDHLYPNVKFKQIGRLCFYMTPEWAPGGYYTNLEWHYVKLRGRTDLNLTKIPNPTNLEIREFVWHLQK